MKKQLGLFILSGLLVAPQFALGAGYQMRYQSAETMGTGFASDVTNAKTASGFFNNPAIIAFMDEGKHFSAEFTTLIPSGSFEGSTEYGANGAPGNADGFSDVSVMPSLYYGQKIADKMFVTATLTVPWATNSEYDEDWIGRYHATKTYLATYNLTTSFVYAVNEKLAVSAGPQIQYATGELGVAADVGLSQIGSGGVPGQDDALIVFDGDNIGFGIALAALYKHSDNLRLGFQYRSQITHNLKGQQSVKGTGPFSNGFASIADGNDVETEISIPDNITLGASYLLKPKIDLHASLSWTGWSSFDELFVDNTSGGPDSTTVLDWKDTVFVAFGSDYYMNEVLTLRGGLSYETGAPPDDRRTPRGVDDDRMGLNLGASYKLSETLNIHGGFTQLIFLDKPSINLPDPAPPSPNRLTGEFSTSASLIRLGVSAKF